MKAFIKWNTTSKKKQNRRLRSFKKLLKYQNQLVLRNNLVYHKIGNNLGNSTMQFILPSKFRERALEACHDEIRHLGFERSVNLLRDRFFWSSMSIDMEKKIKKL